MTKLRLTAADHRYAMPEKIGTVINQSLHADADSLPSMQSQPELYHVCSIHGIQQPMWVPIWKRYVKRSCDCVRQEREQRQQQEKQDAWLEWARVNCYGGWLGDVYRDAKIASEMCGKTFDTYLTEAFSEFPQFFAYADAPTLKGNALLCGSYGTGKSHLLAAAINHRREKFHNKCLFASAPQLFGAYEEAKHVSSWDQNLLITIRQRLVQAEILVIDDIDKEWRGEWKQPELHSIYYYIFDERYKARRPTLVSTNNQDELAKYIGAAARSRLMSKCQAHMLYSEDFRAMEEW